MWDSYCCAPGGDGFDRACQFLFKSVFPSDADDGFDMCSSVVVYPLEVDVEYRFECGQSVNEEACPLCRTDQFDS